MLPPSLPEKPLSIWLTQILFGLVLVPMGLIFPVALAVCIARGFTGQCLAFPSLVTAAVIIGFCSLLGLASWGLQTRRRFSRWLAIALLTTITVILFSQSPLLRAAYQVAFQSPLPTPSNAQPPLYPGKGELFVRAALQAILYALPEFLALRLAIAPDVRQFLRRQP